MSSNTSTVITTIDIKKTTNKARERYRIGEIVLFSYAVCKNKDDGSVRIIKGVPLSQLHDIQMSIGGETGASHPGRMFSHPLQQAGLGKANFFPYNKSKQHKQQ
eukprot:1026250-Ditylum_brightwellii.AAC.1